MQRSLTVTLAKEQRVMPEPVVLGGNPLFQQSSLDPWVCSWGLQLHMDAAFENHNPLLRESTWIQDFLNKTVWIFFFFNRLIHLERILHVKDNI